MKAWQKTTALWTAALLSVATAPRALAAVETYAQTFDPKKEQPKATVRRQKNLDQWDADTLAWFLDNSDDATDAAVMFYAQWDSNSHALAPYWDRIATVVRAGTVAGNLVMALFDCERDLQHATLCKNLRITHYPTILYIGSGPYPNVSGKNPANGMDLSVPTPNAVKFSGNWQYTDSILDWIRVMKGLSKWHHWSTQGFGSKMRNAFFWWLPANLRKKNRPLPVGIPPGRVAAASSSSSAATVAEGQLQVLKKKNDELETSVVRTSTMIDTLLETKAQPVDVFRDLHQRNAWDNDGVTDDDNILRACALEVSLDYCQRVATHVANDIVDALDPDNLAGLDLTVLEEQILKGITEREPFCPVLEQCLANGMEPPEQCYPTECPFQNPTACRYLESCLQNEMRDAYATAMGLKPPSSDADGTKAAA